MSLSMVILNIIVVRAGGTDGVAVFTTGWRVATFASLPLIGISTAVIAVTGAAYGSGAYHKLSTAYYHAIKIGLAIEVVIAAATFMFAPQITLLFTFSEDAARISGDLIVFLRTMCFYYPAVAFGMFSSSMFQGTGKGMNALIVTIFRTIVLAVPLAFAFSLQTDLGLSGVWLGVVTGNVIGALSAFAWAVSYIRGLKRGFESPSLP
jgi:Na+-driven multidrug efflux pump